MPSAIRTRSCTALVTLLLFTGCASTKIERAGSPLTEPLCQTGAPAVSAAVFWAPQWRPDQKQPPLREAAALRGIQDFFGHLQCLTVSGVNRLSAEQVPPSDQELLRLATSHSPSPERVVLIIVRELGPRLVIGIPAVVEGGTEVVVNVRVLNALTSESLADVRTSWRNGGTFVIKGVKSLDQDMNAALSATLMSTAAAK